MDSDTIKRATQLRKAHLNLAQYALEKGYSITVHYGDYEDDELVKSTDFNEIKEASEACDESYMVIHNREGKKLGWSWVIFGNEDDELISDYSVTPFMEDWNEQFVKMYEETSW